MANSITVEEIREQLKKNSISIGYNNSKWVVDDRWIFVDHIDMIGSQKNNVLESIVLGYYEITNARFIIDKTGKYLSITYNHPSEGSREQDYVIRPGAKMSGDIPTYNKIFAMIEDFMDQAIVEFTMNTFDYIDESNSVEKSMKAILEKVNWPSIGGSLVLNSKSPNRNGRIYSPIGNISV